MTPTPIDTTFELTALQLAQAIGTDLQTSSELLDVAVNEVESYSPKAPGANKREAVIRFAGYLKNAENLGVSSQSFGPKSAEIIVNHSSAFRNSGAAMLLTRYKRRRGGKV